MIEMIIQEKIIAGVEMMIENVKFRVKNRSLSMFKRVSFVLKLKVYH